LLWRAVALIGEDDLMPIPGYRFSEELAYCAAALFAEVPELRGDLRSESRQLRTPQGRSVAQSGLLRELAECVLLLQLNTHLVDYFRDPYALAGNDRGRGVETLSRDHFAEVLRGNRPLQVITRDIAERPVFTWHAAWADQPTDDVGSAGGRDGAYFQRLAPMVPHGTRIGRDGNDVVRIDTPQLQVRLTTRFWGANAHLPEGFRRHYLKASCDPGAGVRAYEVIVEVRSTPKPGLRMPQGRQVRTGWLEDFLSDSQEEVDFTSFLTSISWPSVAAILRCLEPGDGRAEGPRA
jgi:hypothetical protein